MCLLLRMIKDNKRKGVCKGKSINWQIKSMDSEECAYFVATIFTTKISYCRPS